MQRGEREMLSGEEMLSSEEMLNDAAPCVGRGLRETNIFGGP